MSVNNTATREANVGRNFTNIRFKTFIATLGLLALGVLAPSMMDAQAFTAVAQTTPATSVQNASGVIMARDASTFESDKALNAACRKTDSNAATRETCLCVTHILKYELTLREYRAAVRIYGVAGDRSRIHATSQDEGISSADIAAAERAERALIGASDFAARCAKAKAYYK